VIRRSRRALLELPNSHSLAGDVDGAATLHRIMAAVADLANTTPPGASALTEYGAPGDVLIEF
jgi:hypothetical protein